MTARHVIALILLVCGVGVLLVSALGLVVLPGPYSRLHALTSAGSVGAPLVVLALAVETGAGRAAVKLLIIALLLGVGGTVTTMAIGRATAQREGLVPGDAPR